MNSGDLSGRHIKLDIAPAQDANKIPPKKQHGKKPSLESDTRSLIAYYKECATED
jgi:hypothetical protein